jgi:hypothetical protein
MELGSRSIRQVMPSGRWLRIELAEEGGLSGFYRNPGSRKLAGLMK